MNSKLQLDHTVVLFIVIFHLKPFEPLTCKHGHLWSNFYGCELVEDESISIKNIVVNERRFKILSNIDFTVKSEGSTL